MTVRGTWIVLQQTGGFIEGPHFLAHGFAHERSDLLAQYERLVPQLPPLRYIRASMIPVVTRPANAANSSLFIPSPWKVYGCLCYTL
jgi:hypothetical protein